MAEMKFVNGSFVINARKAGWW